MKRICVWALVFSLMGVTAGCFWFARKYEKNPSLPVYDNVLEMEGLNGQVKIYRDQYGVPHIFSEDEHDLFFSVGYVQAQDRLWEMVLLRAVAEGRTSELFGLIGIPGADIKGMPLCTYGIDKRQRIMGMKWLGEAGAALLKETNPQVYRQLEAYCDGVNSFISSHQDYQDLPVEFQVLRMKPEPFRVADVMSLGRFIGSMLGGNMGDELLRYGLFKKHGHKLGWQLMPLHHALGPTIVPKDMLHNRLDRARALPPGGRPSEEELGISTDEPLAANHALKLMLKESSIRKLLYTKSPLASNNWIVGPELTETGNAMLANDPHLTHIQPSLFYMMHIKGAGFDSYGVTFPGNPYTVLGHTRKLSWGATTSKADVQDLFIETAGMGHGDKYKYKGDWRDFVVREEKIKIRVGQVHIKKKLKIKHSIHGPIINDIADLPRSAPPVALRWTGWDFDRNPQVFKALVKSKTTEEFISRYRDIPDHETKMMNVALMYNRIMKGESIEDFKKAMDLIVVPNQNWVAADAAGNIAYLPGGLVPMRKKGLGVMPVPGENGEFDWEGFIPLMELPHAINPERGYMATANNEVVDAEWYPYVFSTDYGSGWRAWRIGELIEELAPLSENDMKRIQNDIYVKKAEWMVPIILRAVERVHTDDSRVVEAADIFKQWDYEADLDTKAPVIFYQFNKELAENILKDELPCRDYRAYLSDGQDRNIERWLNSGYSPFFDDKDTDEREDMDDMIIRSLKDTMDWAVTKLGPDRDSWKWGDVHYIKWYHPLGFASLKDLSVGPYPHPGGSGTVRNASPAGFGSDPYKCLGGPVLRHIMDMGSPDEALMVIDGSQSGQWLSPHYRDMHKLWLESNYIQTVMDPEMVVERSRNMLLLEPSEKE